jgi:5-methylthioribose kinase
MACMRQGRAQEVEELDIESPRQAVAYLRETGLVAQDEEPTLHVLKGGVSNRTLLVQPRNNPAFVLKQALPKLRVPTDWFSDPERIHREALGLRVLKEISPPGTITPLLFEDANRHIIAMVAVPHPHRNWKEQLLAEGPSEEYILQFAGILGAIHRESAHRVQMLSSFEDRSWFESLRIEPYYQFSATQVKEAGGFFSALVDETRRTRLALVHGDYSPKNILIHNHRMVLIDHEVIHFGDPAFDVGFSLTHLLSKALHCQERRRAFIDAAQHYVTSYLDIVGNSRFDLDFESRACRHTLGCLLARVVGRSPLEYLTLIERHRQRTAVLNLMRRPPTLFAELIDSFAKELDCR